MEYEDIRSPKCLIPFDINILNCPQSNLTGEIYLCISSTHTNIRLHIIRLHLSKKRRFCDEFHSTARVSIQIIERMHVLICEILHCTNGALESNARDSRLNNNRNAQRLNQYFTVKSRSELKNALKPECELMEFLDTE